MLKNILDLLVIEEYYGVSNSIDTAKGKYKVPYTWGEVRKQLKRIWHG
jgi:hypothetical protein